MMTAARSMLSLGRRIMRHVLTFPSNTPTARSQVWSIGVYEGLSPIDLAPAKHVDNPVLTGRDVSDVPAEFVADPFMLWKHDMWYMFFEVMNRRSGKGEIGLATSGDGATWEYQQIVLSEPFHLSYPYVFEWNHEVYMLPESGWADSIRLYKATEFPVRWSFVATLINGDKYCDPSIVFFNGRWWLFSGLGAPPFRADTLRLYFADEPRGPWVEHPRSPIVLGNARMARPAGRVLQFGNRLVRYAQDCYPTYGTRVRAFEIMELTTAAYREQEVDRVPVLQGGIDAWNRSGMHHIDLHCMANGRWIACVDGWRTAGALERWRGARVESRWERSP